MSIIRILALLTIIAIVYIGFGFIAQLDQSIFVQYKNYNIEISSIFAGLSLLIAYIMLLYITKLITNIFSLPGYLANKFSALGKQKTIDRLFRAYAAAISGAHNDAYFIATNLKKHINGNNLNDLNLILSVSAPNIDQKMFYLRELLAVPEHSFYAAKSLAKYELEQGNPEESLEYLQQTFKLDNSNPELLLLMMQASAESRNWEKFEEYTEKLKKYHPNLAEQHNAQIAEWYLRGSRRLIAQSEDKKAMDFAKNALEWQPDLLDAIEEFCWLHNNIGNKAAIMDIVKSSFKSRPSFELFLLYRNACSEEKPEKLYKTFTHLVQPSDAPIVFLAIASYLGLSREVDSLNKHITRKE